MPSSHYTFMFLLITNHLSNPICLPPAYKNIQIIEEKKVCMIHLLKELLFSFPPQSFKNKAVLSNMKKVLLLFLIIKNATNYTTSSELKLSSNLSLLLSSPRSCVFWHSKWKWNFWQLLISLSLLELKYHGALPCKLK